MKKNDIKLTTEQRKELEIFSTTVLLYKQELAGEAADTAH
jgi:hypothetical protein